MDLVGIVNSCRFLFNSRYVACWMWIMNVSDLRFSGCLVLAGNFHSRLVADLDVQFSFNRCDLILLPLLLQRAYNLRVFFLIYRKPGRNIWVYIDVHLTSMVVLHLHVTFLLFWLSPTLLLSTYFLCTFLIEVVEQWVTVVEISLYVETSCRAFAGLWVLMTFAT